MNAVTGHAAAVAALGGEDGAGGQSGPEGTGRRDGDPGREGPGRPRPVVFGDIMGWFHPASVPASGAPGRRGVLLCPAEGYEALCAHRPWRDLAERLAAAGLPALRFDYPGTGDSGGPEETAPDLPGWTAAAVAAAGELRRLSGVEEVSLVGLRLGAAVAAMAAVRMLEAGRAPAPVRGHEGAGSPWAERDGPGNGRAEGGGAADGGAGDGVVPVPAAASGGAGGPGPGGATNPASLALLFPVLSGRTHARELKLMAQRTEEGPEILGYPWSDEALAAVGALDAGTLLREGGRPALLLTRPAGLTAAEAVAGALSAGRALAADGFEALFAEAHAAAAPEAAFDEIVGFLTGRTGAAGGTPTPGAAADRVAEDGARGAGPTANKVGDGWRGVAMDGPVLRLPGGVTERAVRFGPGDGLIGAWTEPAGGARAGAPVLLIPNTGANHHVGNGRLGVLIARRAAASGMPALRFDSRGIGESENPDGLATVRLVYQPSVIADSRAALDWLEARGHRAVTAVGVCAGAWTSLQLALADRRVVRAVPVNLQRFVWREGRILTVPARRQSAAAASGLQWRALADAWRNRAAPLDLLRALLPPPVKLAYKRNVVAAGAWVGRRQPAGMPLVGPARVVGWLRALSARGTAVTFVYSDEDVGIAELESHFGPGGKHLTRVRGMTLVSLPGADHVLSTRAMRRGLLARLGDAVLPGAAPAAEEDLPPGPTAGRETPPPAGSLDPGDSSS